MERQWNDNKPRGPFVFRILFQNVQISRHPLIIILMVLITGRSVIDLKELKKGALLIDKKKEKKNQK